MQLSLSAARSSSLHTGPRTFPSASSDEVISPLVHWADIWKCTVEKSQTNAANPPFMMVVLYQCIGVIRWHWSYLTCCNWSTPVTFFSPNLQDPQITWKWTMDTENFMLNNKIVIFVYRFERKNKFLDWKGWKCFIANLVLSQLLIFQSTNVPFLPFLLSRASPSSRHGHIMKKDITRIVKLP